MYDMFNIRKDCVYEAKNAYSMQKFNMRNMHFDTPTGPQYAAINLN